MKNIIKLLLPIAIRNTIRWTYRSAKARFEIALWAFLGRPLYSIVIPCHNVEKYVNELLESIFDQIGKSRKFEVIVVDDGSEDRTLEILREWETRYKGILKVVQLDRNRGVSAARNRGLDVSRGIWVTFPDGDDILGQGYIRNAIQSIHSLDHLNLMILQCELRFFREESKTIEDTHPLRYRFRSAKPIKVKNLGNRFMMSVATIWIKRNYILRSGIRFNENLKIAEDATFIGELCLVNPEAHIKFLRGSAYLYRKRSDKSSTLDTSTREVSWLISPLESFMLRLIDHPILESGTIPTWLQHEILYDITWKIRALLDDSNFADSLTSQEEEFVFGLMQKVFDSIDESVILAHEIVMRRVEKLGILQVFKKSTMMDSPVYFIRHYQDSGSILVDYHSEELEISTSNSLDGLSKVVYRKNRKILLLGRIFLNVNTNFVKQPFFASIQCRTLEGKVLPIYAKNGKLLTKGSLKSSEYMPYRVAGLSTNSEAEDSSSRIDILLMDRVSMARDNAEALYRYISKHYPSVRIGFVLSRYCPDWDRLRLEGFNLVEYQSRKHNLALVTCKIFASSSLDDHILYPDGLSRGRHKYFKYVFLQHGVIQNDLSNWLNSKPISLMVTSTVEEHKSIADNSSPYAFHPDQIIRTGLPRWDSLRALADQVEIRNFLTIAPTWRKDLVKQMGSDSALTDLRESNYFVNWEDAIARIASSESVIRNGLEIVVLTHPAFNHKNGPLFNNQLVRYLDGSQSFDYGEIIARSKVLITDYSSIAFDAAACGGSVLYFQFDKQEVFSNKHIFKPGYFNYQSDGFGAVSENSADLLDQLNAVLGQKSGMGFGSRAEQVFDKFDGKSCERVTHSLLALLED